MPIVCGPISCMCKNCGHYIYLNSNGEIHHFTRAYHLHGFPYSSPECYFVIKEREAWNKRIYCGCKNPEIDYSKLPELESKIIQDVIIKNDIK